MDQYLYFLYLVQISICNWHTSLLEKDSPHHHPRPECYLNHLLQSFLMWHQTCYFPSHYPLYTAISKESLHSSPAKLRTKFRTKQCTCSSGGEFSSKIQHLLCLVLKILKYFCWIILTLLTQIVLHS